MINKNIIVVGQQAWDIEIGSNCKNIALEFSKQNKVLYVNPPLDRISFLRNRKDNKIKKRLQIIKGKEPSVIKIKDNLWNLYPEQIIESINWIKNRRLYNFLNKINNKRLAASILKAIDKLQLKEVILFNDGDMFRSFYLNELIKNKLSIYYSRDYLLATDYYKYHGTILEPLLIKKSNLSVANSTYLAEYCKKYNPNSYYVGQGCDQLVSSNVNFSDKPDDMKAIKNPIIGYVGVLFTARLDIDILLFIATNNPEWQLVLVGPEDETFMKSELHTKNNVHFLGPKNPNELASYINAFDVCINPQILNELTIGNYPRKVDEYLSMGKPVVATKTVAMEVFKEVVELAEIKEQYPDLIAKALNEDSLEMKIKRQVFAAMHTWENSVQEIYRAIDTVTNKI